MGRAATTTRAPRGFAWRLAGGLLAAALGLGSVQAADAPPLPKLHLDSARVAVVGLSAGAYMAGQAQLAYPEWFANAALVAGGPWNCADGSLKTALTACLKGNPRAEVPGLVARAGAWAKEGRLGDLAHLAHARVYLLRGRDDATVSADVAAASASFYRALAAQSPALRDLQLVVDDQRDFGHNLPVARHGDDCRLSQSPFLGGCGFDAAGAIFARMFGAPPRQADGAHGELRRFDQDALRIDGADAYLARTGYLYVPPACAAGQSCGLLVAFHGCKQDAASVGTAFVQDAGFNRWADVYGVVVLYPQARASFAPLNPQACWDWWGYSGANYATRDGAQLRWLVHAVQALGAGAGIRDTGLGIR
ncbi:MAG: hypothetical protein EPN56_02205 [Rhodanobacter sp.]|nr:MAG: hypothetical protein EPN78_04010 [Rhodanobacter sp.]TAM14614.1 MAG: hypothetical protein EPN66_01970 [Rhodanobacter sp.]TAM37406.1 MAG: hypothetical protein EPN56_02205 [Rhodanobacter sp.]